jgi:hypothetical protein
LGKCSADIDYSRVLSHLRIHHSGRIAGGEFNDERFPAPQDVIAAVQNILPPTLQYDINDRTELTAELSEPIVGYQGVIAIKDAEATTTITLEQGMRLPNGTPSTFQGIRGAWYPERAFNQDTQQFEIITDGQGTPVNPYCQFVPLATIAIVDQRLAEDALATNCLTAIIQRNPATNQPTMLTIFPGQNAPAFPEYINAANWKKDTLHDPATNAFWETHAFTKIT